MVIVSEGGVRNWSVKGGCGKDTYLALIGEGPKWASDQILVNTFMSNSAALLVMGEALAG
jgi:hypothetical protein